MLAFAAGTLSAQTPSAANEQRDLQQALAKAREQLAQAQAELAEGKAARAVVAQQTATWQRKWTEARAIAEKELGAQRTLLSRFQKALDQVALRKARLQQVMQDLLLQKQQLQADTGNAEAAAAHVCQLAQQAATGTPEQAKTWQTDAKTTIDTASSRAGRADHREAAANATADLKTALVVAEGYQVMPGVAENSGAMGEIKAALHAAEEAEGPLSSANLAAQKYYQNAAAIANRVQATLERFSNPEVVQLRAAARDLARLANEKPAAAQTEDLMAATRAAVQELQQVQTEVTEVRSSSNEVVEQGESSLEAVAEAERALNVAKADPRRAEALQRAAGCLAQIKVAPNSVAAASPVPSPSPAAATDEVRVPDLSVFDSVEEMKAALRHLDLTGAFAQGTIEPPEKKKEFKFASQSPAAHTLVKKNSVVAVTTYPKFVARTLVSGVYQVETDNRGTVHPSTWKLTVTRNKISGSSDWQCCPGKRKDPLSGEINQEGNTVVITRDCNGQGITQPCRQVYVGEVVGGIIQGTFSGTLGSKRDNSPQNIWVLHLK